MRITLITAILFIFYQINSYSQTSQDLMLINDLPEIHLTNEVSLHFISPEPIQYVDLSSHNLTGDLPSEQIARVKINEGAGKAITISDSIQTFTATKKLINGEVLGIITIVGQSFMAQYKVIYNSYTNENIAANIKIQADDMQPLEYNTMKLSNHELKSFTQKIEKNTIKKPIRTEKDLKLEMSINNVYVMNDYIFVDLSVKNKTNLSYDVDAIKFTIEDKRIYKATNSQIVELTPLFKHNNINSFNRNYRNIYVFKKFTFPNSKIFKVRLIENQISGRTIEIKVKYSDILNADTI